MRYKLVIAEKPSVAQSLAAVIGATARKDGYLEGNGWRVSWCVGHLAGLADADSYDPKYAKWRYDDLPILPEHWQMVVGKDKKKQFDILKKLMNAPDVTEVVNACDAGREGELIFQPAEEGVRGAYAIVENGWLDDVDVLLASHIAPTGQADDGDVTVGTWGSLATTKYDAVFTGRAAHAGGFPEQGKNALLAAASAALALHAIPRHSGGQSFVNVGTLRAGSGRNVVPDHALMQVEVRGETTEINRFMMARTEEICRGAAAMQGCVCSLTVMGTAEGQHSDLALIERIGAVIRRDLPGLTLSTEQNAKNWGSDDVSVMMNRVQAHGGQAAYMRAMADMAGAQHTVTFDFDEAVLGKSVAVFCAAAMALMGEEA